jgi:hypothetical protein
MYVGTVVLDTDVLPYPYVLGYVPSNPGVSGRVRHAQCLPLFPPVQVRTAYGKRVSLGRPSGFSDLSTLSICCILTICCVFILVPKNFHCILVVLDDFHTDSLSFLIFRSQNLFPFLSAPSIAFSDVRIKACNRMSRSFDEYS